MVDWFRVFIGTVGVINTAANLSTSASSYEIAQLQKDAATIEMVRNLARDIIFSTRRTAEKLAPLAEDRPFLGYVVAELLEIRFRDLGITSEFFPDFQEKTYLADTEDIIGNLKRTAAAILTKEQLADGKKAVKIVLTDGLLEAYIQHLDKVEQLQDLKQSITALESRRNEINAADKKGKIGTQRTMFGLVLGVGVVLACVVPLIGMIFGSFLRDTLGQTVADIYNLIICLIPIIGAIMIIVGALFMFQKSSARKEIDSKIDALKKQFQAIKQNLATDEDLQKFVAEFGNLTHAEAVQLNLENDAFISRLTTEEEFEQYFKITPS